MLYFELIVAGLIHSVNAQTYFLNRNLRQTAAVHLLKSVGLYGQDLKSSGPIESEEVKRKWRENDQLNSLLANNNATLDRIKKGWDETENHPTSGNRAANIIQALKEEDDDVCEKAAEVLGKIGPDAKAAIPALIQTLKKGWLDDDSDVSESAAKALEKINIEAEATEGAEFDF